MLLFHILASYSRDLSVTWLGAQGSYRENQPTVYCYDGWSSPRHSVTNDEITRRLFYIGPELI